MEKSGSALADDLTLPVKNDPVKLPGVSVEPSADSTTARIS